MIWAFSSRQNIKYAENLDVNQVYCQKMTGKMRGLFRRLRVALHVPVLYQPVIELLRLKPGGMYIDGTVGAGGHALGILTGSAPSGRLLAFDRDKDAIEFCRTRLAEFSDRISLINESYSEMARMAPLNGFQAVDGVLLDLGLSSRQLEDNDRGFSFKKDGPLDMRFDRDQGQSAADLVNDLEEDELAGIFWRYGEVAQSRRIARQIVRQRPILRTSELVKLVEETTAGGRSKRRMKSQTAQVFQALRIATNDELTLLADGLKQAVSLLKPFGRLVVISFHSLEDRIVKGFIRLESTDCICPPEQPVCTCDHSATLRSLTRKPIGPTEEEIRSNPRSRSARLRAAEKLAGAQI